ncbi:hypothetical protein [Actinomadura sp. WMMB 499]|uniref:hypothetical protein n=1 Tax=Actinomadura sp. WMMB 499 TaxID=1219491 RepID=UPI0012484CFB|nr:hypothetical protein [Actinomadura sp. WMMB 499]QFG24418.1 hypothetical protein F7P10_28115 [Actinomadura sp. WMMB 499]
MRNTGLEKLDGLVGTWAMTLSNAPFLLEGTEVPGTATIEWLGEAFLTMVQTFEEGEGRSTTTGVFGRSDANDAYVVLYHDERGVCREFAMTFEGGHWTMLREDPDFHQRFVGDVEKDRILGRWEASEDEGATWRKDFDVLFVRT